jgi:hypothetical protein
MERLISSLFLEVSKRLTNSVGYCQIAKENLEPLHPAFSLVQKALESGESASAMLKRFGNEWRRRQLKGSGGGSPDYL